jgi:hypothetical protein
MGPRLSLGGRVDVVYPSDLIATRIVSVFMSVWFSFFFVDLRCFTSRSETLGPETLGKSTKKKENQTDIKTDTILVAMRSEG